LARRARAFAHTFGAFEPAFEPLLAALDAS
jgi:hypothetical protein